jgi:hypothetical protein
MQAALAVLLVAGSYENPWKGPCPTNETSLKIAASSLFTLYPETVVQHPVGIDIQFPDSAFPFLVEGSGGKKMMFWTDGKTYRTTGASLYNQSTPDPATPVLGNGPNNTYDMNGNWLLSVHRLSDMDSGVGSTQELVGFTHVENHQFNCSGPYAEWNAAAVVRSSDDGQSWSRQGLAIYDPQPCAPKFGGAGFCSVLPDRGPSDVAFRAWGGCTSYISKSPVGAAGSWKRYYNGSFGEDGVGGKESCLPGLGQNIACPNVIWSSFWQQYVMVYSNWGQNQLLLLRLSTDGVSWSEPVTLVNASDAPRELAYGAIVGRGGSGLAGEVGTLVYAANPPTSKWSRDFIAREIRFHPVGDS